MDSGSPVSQIIGAVILIGVLVLIGVLALHGTIAGSDAMVTITAIVGIAGGAMAVHAGVTAGAKAANTPPQPPA